RAVSDAVNRGDGVGVVDEIVTEPGRFRGARLLRGGVVVEEIPLGKPFCLVRVPWGRRVRVLVAEHDAPLGQKELTLAEVLVANVGGQILPARLLGVFRWIVRIEGNVTERA